MVVTMLGATMAMPLGATVAYLISRIEGFFGPLSILQVMGAVGMAILTFYPPMWWLISIYRPERSAELTLTLSDAGWLQWVGGLTIYYPTIITIAIAAFIDKSPEPAFPRWFGYANLWLVILLLPGQMIFFFKTGPLAWNGLIAFYRCVHRFRTVVSGGLLCVENGDFASHATNWGQKGGAADLLTAWGITTTNAGD